MKLRSTIVSSFLLILYAGVLLHNTIPHMHTEEQADHATTHQHHHSNTDAHDHHEGSDDASPEAPLWSDLAGLFTHTSLEINHFGDFTGAQYSFVPSVIGVILLLLGSRWPRLLLYRVTKPPGDAPDQRLQLLRLSATSRRGPPVCS